MAATLAGGTSGLALARLRRLLSAYRRHRYLLLADLARVAVASATARLLAVAVLTVPLRRVANLARLWQETC